MLLLLLLQLQAQFLPRAAGAALPPHCSQYSVLFKQADADLSHWRGEAGRPLITQAVMREAVRQYATPNTRSMHYGFVGGKAYMLTPAHASRHNHHLHKQLAYTRMLLHLQMRTRVCLCVGGGWWGWWGLCRRP